MLSPSGCVALTARRSIFSSAVSRELKSARQLVANTLTALSYQPGWQDIFGTEQNDLREMLRRRPARAKASSDSSASATASGHAPDDAFGRVSSTQYEALHARAVGTLLVRDCGQHFAFCILPTACAAGGQPFGGWLFAGGGKPWPFCERLSALVGVVAEFP